MRATFLLIILSFFAATYSYGQKLEVGIQLNSGFSSFVGESATSSSALIYYPNRPESRAVTERSYGNKLYANSGISVQVQQVFGNSFLVGAQAGVESLRSSVDINRVYEYRNNTLRVFEASGSTRRRYDFVNIAPYFGRRINLGVFNMDLMLGTDVGIGFYAEERAKATYANGEEVVSKFELSTPKVDVRPRVGATVYYKRFGLTSSYAHGLTNYMQNYVDANPKAHPKAYMRVLRLGLSYKIK